jgi:transcriptional regulator with XRE-family HTH domain
MPKIEQKTQKATDAVKILDRTMDNDSQLRQLANEAVVNAEVAQLIHKVRSKAKLTQKQLAELVGTTQSVIARLEDADYEGHSLSMLQRIAAAVNKRLEVRFVSAARKATNGAAPPDPVTVGAAHIARCLRTDATAAKAQAIPA